MKRLHYRKNIDKDWFSKYAWLESEENNQEILIFANFIEIEMEHQNFQKVQMFFRLDKIKKHSNTNEHKESELMLLNSYQTESNRDNTEQQCIKFADQFLCMLYKIF